MATPAERLDADRRELLDLSLRNTLLNFRRLRTKGVEIVDERSDQIFRILVLEGKKMSFLAAEEGAGVQATDSGVAAGDELAFAFEQPDEEATDDNGVALRHLDSKLQTPHQNVRLQRRLLNTYHSARTTIEEHGVNTLFLALGMLEWFEADQSEMPRLAPLILVPVELDRDNVNARFKVANEGGEVGANLSLYYKLKRDFGINLPLFDAEGDVPIGEYFSHVEAAIGGQERWRVERDAMQLGFFSFTKLLMYEDLNPATWQEGGGGLAHAVMAPLLGDGFGQSKDAVPDGPGLDQHLDITTARSISDVDSSQALAICDVMSGRNLIIQGPPGTGKSQTITNLIAECVAGGRKILFVAEKMAALEVVKRRLAKAGLGELCLELHSHKTHRKALLEDLRATWELGDPGESADQWDRRDLAKERERLNAYCAALHTPIARSGLTPFHVYGELMVMGRQLKGVVCPRLELRDGEAWTREDYKHREDLVEDLQVLTETIGPPDAHPFSGSGLQVALPSLRERLESKASEAITELDELTAVARAFSDLAQQAAPGSLDEIDKAVVVLDRALAAPPLEGVTVADDDWRSRRQDLSATVASGRRLVALHSAHDHELIAEAWGEDVLESCKALSTYGRKWWRFLVREFRAASRLTSRLFAGEAPKELAKRLEALDAILEAQRQLQVLESHKDLMAKLLGHAWRGLASDWDLVARTHGYLGRLHDDLAEGAVPSEVLGLLRHNVQRKGMEATLQPLRTAAQRFRAAWSGISQLLALDETKIAPDGLGQLPLGEFRRFLERWREESQRAQEIVRFNDLRSRMHRANLGDVIALASHWEGASLHLVPLFRRRYLEALIEGAFSSRHELRHFSRPFARGLRGAFLQARRRHLRHGARCCGEGALGWAASSRRVRSNGRVASGV